MIYEFKCQATGTVVMTREVAEILRKAEQAHEKCQIGSYPFFREGKVGANFVVRSTDAEELANCVHTLCDALAEAGHGFTPGGI